MNLTRQQAIEQKCFDCSYDPQDSGTKHQQVERCMADDCALWEYRPITHATKDRIKQEKIANFSPDELKEHNRKAELFRSRLSQQKQAKNSQ